MVHDRGERRLLRLVGLAFPLAAGRQRCRQPASGSGRGTQRLGDGAQARSSRRARLQPRPARLVQVLRLLRHLVRQHARLRRAAHLATDAGRPAGRHLVPHVSRPHVRPRRLPRQAEPRSHRRLRALCRLLPLSHGRTHRAGSGLSATAAYATRPAPDRRQPRLLPHPLGPREEGAHR